MEKSSFNAPTLLPEAGLRSIARHALTDLVPRAQTCSPCHNYLVQHCASLQLLLAPLGYRQAPRPLLEYSGFCCPNGLACRSCHTQWCKAHPQLSQPWCEQCPLPLAPRAYVQVPAPTLAQTRRHHLRVPTCQPLHQHTRLTT